MTVGPKKKGRQADGSSGAEQVMLTKGTAHALNISRASENLADRWQVFWLFWHDQRTDNR